MDYSLEKIRKQKKKMKKKKKKKKVYHRRWVELKMLSELTDAAKIPSKRSLLS